MDLTSKVMAFGRKARLEAERAARAAVPAVKDAAERIAPAMRDAAERVTPAVKDAAGKAAEKARETAAQVPVAARRAAEAVARKLGIAQCLSEQLPEDKLESFKQFKRENGMCGFVGDGINDAPVLACADVGIAMGQFGSQAAVEASDVVVMTDDLSKIPRAVALSRRTYNLAMQNLYFSVLVKLAILILGALGFANIWLAIFGDVGVLILAVLNAMRSLSFVKVKEYTALKDRA